MKKIDLSWFGKRHAVILAIVAAVTFGGVFTYTTFAYCFPGSILGRTCYQGYFTNTFDQYGDNVLPVVKNGQALPTTDIYNTDTLFNALRDAYYSGNAQRHTGASFIYNTMEGNNAPGIGKGISFAQWEDLRIRVDALDKAGKIDWYGNVSANTNSYWQGPNTDDDAYYGEFKNEEGILIRDYNNNVIYRLLRRCANPIGDSFKVPELQNYTLTPTVNSINPDEVVESNAKMGVTTRVENVGNATSQNVQWEITQINVKPGKKAPHEDEGPTVSGEAPCQSVGGAPFGNYFRSADADCRNVGKGTGTYPLGTSIGPSVSDINIGDLPVGTRVCFSFSLQPRSNLDAAWAHAKPRCTIVGKKPKVQIWGGDVSVKGRIDTSTSTKEMGGPRVFGSWVEYGAFSAGVNSLFASGAGTNNQSSNDQADWSKFTFANKDESSSNAYGNYTLPTNFRTAPNIAAYFGSLANKQAITPAPSVDISSLSFLNGDPIVVRTAADLTIAGSNIAQGRSVIILATGTVTIDGDINYANGPFTNIKQIPQVVIIAQNIIVKDTVSHIDAWLVASDTINTCYSLVGNPTSDKCNLRLEVNGPVVTNKLVLNRTAGSNPGAESGDPAERFNLRPDAALWASLQARGSNKARTVYSTELPPRF